MAALKEPAEPAYRRVVHQASKEAQPGYTAALVAPLLWLKHLLDAVWKPYYYLVIQGEGQFSFSASLVACFGISAVAWILLLPPRLHLLLLAFALSLYTCFLIVSRYIKRNGIIPLLPPSLARALRERTLSELLLQKSWYQGPDLFQLFVAGVCRFTPSEAESLLSCMSPQSQAIFKKRLVDALPPSVQPLLQGESRALELESATKGAAEESSLSTPNHKEGLHLQAPEAVSPSSAACSASASVGPAGPEPWLSLAGGSSASGPGMPLMRRLLLYKLLDVRARGFLRELVPAYYWRHLLQEPLQSAMAQRAPELARRALLAGAGLLALLLLDLRRSPGLRAWLARHAHSMLFLAAGTASLGSLLVGQAARRMAIQARAHPPHRAHSGRARVATTTRADLVQPIAALACVAALWMVIRRLR